jgi:hypothetical protein
MDVCLAEMWSWRKETTACQEATEACLESKKLTTLEVESEAEHEILRKRPQWKLLEH